MITQLRTCGTWYNVWYNFVSFVVGLPDSIYWYHSANFRTRQICRGYWGQL